MYNHYASHRYFKKDSLPSDANVIINARDDKPTLIEYPMGNGIVIASAMTWEHSYNTSGLEYFGRKAFDDLLLYAYTVVNVVTKINKNPGLGYDAYIKVVIPEKGENKVDTGEVCEGVATVVGVSALAYVSYRVVRLLPSCTPWTFWTLPANLATP